MAGFDWTESQGGRDPRKDHGISLVRIREACETVWQDMQMKDQIKGQSGAKRGQFYVPVLVPNQDVSFEEL